MIEKLNTKYIHVESDSTAKLELANKINELVDAVNKHEDIIKQIGEWGSSKGECLWCEKLKEVNLDDRMIGCTTLDIPESYKIDPYAEQRKWIGKLCKFWDDEDEGYIYEILIDIDGSDYPYKIVDVDSKNWTMSYKHCEPVSEDLIYKGGDNE